MTTVLVLGAGMAGVAAAWQLRQRGFDVALVDRRTPGREASFGNAGIIQAEAVEPYAMPRGLDALKATTWAGGNDVHLHLRALPALAGPLARYWWHSAPQRLAAAARPYSVLITHATHEHAPLIEAAGAQALVRRDGFRFVFRSPAALDAAVKTAARLAEVYGVAYELLSPQDFFAAEPGLRGSLAGAIHWRQPWTVSDPGALVAAYADAFTAAGGTFVRGDAGSLTRSSGGWRVQTADGPLDAAAAVVALGAWSPQLLRRFGRRIPMVRKRGYHRHFPQAAGSVDLPFLDAERGYVAAPMTNGLRLTSGAELAFQDAAPTPVQLRRAQAAAGDWLDLGEPEAAEPWLGCRPCMPDMLPVVGEVLPGQGLWAHFGHGHQGFTLGPATGRLLAELMSGHTPFTDPRPLAPQRWERT